MSSHSEGYVVDVSGVDDHTPFMVNNTGFSFGSTEHVWTYAEGPVRLHQTDSGYYLTNEAGEKLPTDVESGTQKGNNPERVWSQINAVAVWHMNEQNIIDITGNTANGMPIHELQTVPGKFSNAIQFQAKNQDYILIQDNKNLDFEDNSMSFTAWIKSPDTTGYQVIYGDYAQATQGWTIYVDNHGNDEIYVYTRDKEIDLWGTTDVKTDEWTHIAFVKDCNKKEARIYINGNLDAIDNNIPCTANMSSTGPATIAAHPDHDEGFYTGLIDEMRIYKTPLTQEQITQMYNNGKGSQGYGNII